MNIRKLSQRIASLSGAATVAVLTAQSAMAAPLNISDVPLNLTTGVKPNLIMAIDDSGSMDFELLLPGNDGAAWWRSGASGSCTTGTDNNSFTGCVANGSTDLPGTGRPNFNNQGDGSNVWKKFAYLFPNGSGGNTTDRRRLADGTNDHFAIPPIPAYGWTRSPDFNRAYFDPATTYTPWPDGGGFTFGNATPTAARFDPVFTGHGTIDLTQDFAGSESAALSEACNNTNLGTVSANYYFRVYTGMVLPAGTCFRSTNPARNWETVRAGMTCQVGVNNQCNVTSSTGVNAVYTLASNSSVAIRYFPATFYLRTATAPASFGYTATPANDGRAPDGSTLYRYEIKSSNFTSTAAYDAAIQNFANWFSYYRKRHQALRAGLGTAFETLAGWNVAGFTINSATTTAPNVTMGDIDDAATRDALYGNFYEDWVRSGGTPNRTAVANIIRNYRRSGAGAPIQYSCQRNFGMLFTDGFSNTPAAGDGISGVYANVDSGRGAPYQDGTSATLADAVMSAYVNNARPDLTPGRVPLPAGCSDSSPDPRLDCNANPHMNFYAVTLNTRGLQFNPDAPVDPYLAAPTWPTAFPARHPSAVDDLWHATINGRGKLLNAASSAELADKLGELLGAMEGEVGSASSAAVSTGSVTSDTRLFQARYDSDDWSGSLSARRVLADGQLLTEVPSSVPSASAREIITVNSDGTPVPFEWASLDATRQAELEPDADTLGASRLEWLRGDRANELPGGVFRERTNILGDIVNSAPVFVGAPNFRYPDTLESAPYSAFRATHMNRTHMVYVGANDGMLHGFYSNDSTNMGVVEERFAFIPGTVFRNLHHLTAPDYEHRYYVDGSPVVGDAFIGGAWRTMLVGGLNNGGQSIYALDVTHPSGLTETNASNVFQWEFTDVDDVDLGNTFSRPSIVRLNSGQWAAVFGNGYNNTLPDGRQSTTGDAVLYIVNLQTGALIKKISTNTGMAADPTGASRPNGLSTPVLADTDGDYDVDAAYAGDLFGNLWKFDLRSTAPAGWVVAYGGTPLFRAADAGGNRQPITARPNVAMGQGGQGLVVVFGTGKYLESSDTSTTPVRAQSFYGLFDPNTWNASDLILTRGNLVEQSITHERLGETFTDDNGVSYTSDIRVVSDRVVPAGFRGWLIDLWSPRVGYEAEKSVTDPLIRENRFVTFTTTIPNRDPCASGGSSWLMELDLFNGGMTDETPWDMNSDGRFDQRDKVNIGGTWYSVNGIRNPNIGIIPRPAVLAGEKCEFLIFPGTSGGTDSRCRNPGPRGFGRQSWRQAQ